MTSSKRRGRACSALYATFATALALTLAACHASPHPATAPRLSPVQQLQHDIDAILAAPALRHSVWGVLVQPASGGAPVYSLHDETLLMPASNMKIVTLAAAASRLGWDFHYETRLLAAGDITGGVLHGDLVAVGSGDPSIGGRDGTPAHVFDAWAENLKAQGLRRVDGRIVGDDNAFEDQTLGNGWTWDDLSEGYAAGISALQFNENSIRVTVSPGYANGSGAIVSIDPVGSGLDVVNAMTTSAADAPGRFDAQRLPGSSRLELHGSVPLGSAASDHTLSVDNPTQFFVNVLRATLIAHGIDVSGPAVDIDDMRDATSRASTTVLLTHRSPPLSALATTLMKASQNLYAETFVKTLSAAAGVATTQGGLAAVRDILQPWGIEDGGLVMRDGSGLSRYNYVTPRTLVTILTHIDQDATLRGPFEAALPIAGRDGTLGRRMAGTPAENNALAKTGSLANARALSGYVTTADGERLVFSIIVNNFETPASVVEQATDAIVARLAAFKR